MKRYAAPASVAPVSSLGVPMSTRSLPTAATELPNKSSVAGVGMVKVVSKVVFWAKPVHGSSRQVIATILKKLAFTVL